VHLWFHSPAVLPITASAARGKQKFGTADERR
jgi:hypothetical protein